MPKKYASPLKPVSTRSMSIQTYYYPVVNIASGFQKQSIHPETSSTIVSALRHPQSKCLETIPLAKDIENDHNLDAQSCPKYTQTINQSSCQRRHDRINPCTFVTTPLGMLIYLFIVKVKMTSKMTSSPAKIEQMSKLPKTHLSQKVSPACVRRPL